MVTMERNNNKIFTCAMLARAVLATATWLAGWLGGCLSHARIVSKWLNLSYIFFRPSVSPIILVSSHPCADTQLQGRPPSAGA